MAPKQGEAEVVYVGPHNEVEVSVLPGRRFQMGEKVSVPKEVAERLLIQADWSTPAKAKVDAKHKASAKAATAAQYNLDPDEGPVYRPEQNNPDDEPEAGYVEPDYETGDTNPSHDADVLDAQPAADDKTADDDKTEATP